MIRLCVNYRRVKPANSKKLKSLVEQHLPVANFQTKNLLFFIGIISTIRRWKDIVSYKLKESLYIVTDP